MDFTTRNNFGPNDTITILLSADAQLSPTASASDIVVDSFVLSSYLVSIQDLNTIKISSFILLVQSNGQLSGTIRISTLIGRPSTKPVTGSQVVFSRNGYNYNSAFFVYSAQQGTLTGNVTLDNNFANSNTSGLWKVTLPTGASIGDRLYFQIPPSIFISACTAQCGDSCTCTITQPTASEPFTTLAIYIGTVLGSNSTLSISTAMKNPISSNEVVEVCSTDPDNFTKQCGSVAYPSISQASLDSSTLSVSNSNDRVYSISNYTLSFNLSSYNHENGFLITTLPPVITPIDPTNVLCTINGQTACTVQSTSPLVLKTTVLSTTKTYSLFLRNIRNPPSTLTFQIKAEIAYTTGAVYYSISSAYLQVSQPFPFTNFSVQTSSCVNSASTTTSVQLLSLPFPINNSIIVVTDLQSNATTDLLFNGQALNLTIVYSHTNWYSLEPANYSFLLKTSDYLWDILSFTIQLTNCEPAYMPLSVAKFTGLQAAHQGTA